MIDRQPMSARAQAERGAAMRAAAVVAVVALAVPAAAEPPFDGLPWNWPNIITADDPSSLSGLAYEGRARRLFWESWRWQEFNVHLFRARYRGGVEIEIHVSPEWRRRRGRNGTERWDGSPVSHPSPTYMETTERERMDAEVRFIADTIGRLPGLYRERIRAASLDAGYWPPSANRERRTVHFLTRANDKLESYGATEEMYVHEAGHLLEDEYATTDCWRNAQASDGEFISVYAASDPGSGQVGDPSGPGGEDLRRDAGRLLRAAMEAGSSVCGRPPYDPGDHPGAHRVHGQLGLRRRTARLNGGWR